MSSHEYVKYIQYTLSASGFYTKAIDGLYGPKTKASVKLFQTNNNERFIDGKVDSETKWYLAKFWLNMKLSTPELFQGWKNFASEDIRKYINAVENMGTTSSINSDKSYKKLTFSGTTGPSTSSDLIFFEAPDDFLKINNIIITADSDPKWRQFKVTLIGWSSTYETDIYKLGGIELLDLSANSGTITIPMNGRKIEDAKYMCINIVGNKIPGFGEAEGFSIARIDIQGIVQPGPLSVPRSDFVYAPMPITVSVAISGTAENISPSRSKLIPLNNLDNIKSLTSLRNGNHYISEIEYPSKVEGINTSITFGPTDQLTLNAVNYENDDIRIKAFSDIKINEPITLSDITLSNVTSAGQSITSEAPISVENSDNILKIETSATYYGDSIVVTSSIDLSVNHMRTVSGVILSSANKNTINYGDGILLFCNAEGKPIGVPTLTEIRTAINSVSSQNRADLQERDLQFGYFVVDSEFPSDGIRYGFYDVEQKEFLGNYLNYVDLYSRWENSISRNTDSIFIGICALDADGRPGDNEFFGINSSSTFMPSRVPLKYIVPIYSVKYNSSSAIKVNEISPNLSKFDSWELPVSSGTFSKEIYISPRNQWFDWKKDYKGQSLLAQYSTLDQQDASWSKIYGHGYYDVVDEYPVILSSKSIRVKRTPILNWNHPTNYTSSIAGLTKSEIKVFTKEAEDSDWIEVPYRLIKDINSYTGVITFKRPLVPASSSLIKVSYTTENKNLLLRHVDGKPIPLNPLLNADVIQFDKPLYIYITPKNIYKKKYSDPASQPTQYVEVLDHSYTENVNFTYDSTIFDILSINYDPFALMLAVIYVANDASREKPKLSDLRLRGGGIKADLQNSELIDGVGEILSYWDTLPAQRGAYTRGGYVIIRMPKEVKDNFIDEKEIYNIIQNNLTAGVVFDLQDMSGDNWS
jgi:hypothetical protein